MRDTMAFENVGEGALFKNKDKRTDSSPDYTGKCTVNGDEIGMSAWINEGKPGSKIAGDKYLAIKFSIKTEAGAMAARYKAGEPVASIFPEDEIPF